MYVDDRGSGTAVLLLHPFPFDGRIYDEVAPRIAERARCLVVDLEGSGRSRAAAPPASLEEHASGLTTLLDERGIDRAVVVGLSFGGYLALVLARMAPGRVSGLVLVGTRSAADTPKILEQRSEATEITRTKGVHALVAKQLPSWFADDPPAAARDVATSIALSQTPDAVLAGLVAMRDRRDATPMLANVRVPTHIVSGRLDKLTTQDEMRKLTAIPGSVFHDIAEAGHLVVLTHPEEFVSAVLACVTAVEAG